MDLQKLREVAGINDHVQIEKKLFDDVCYQLKRLMAFCDNQGDKNTYQPLKEHANLLCAKLNSHLERY